MLDRWRLGGKVPINVYGPATREWPTGRPICQCHNQADARVIVESVNAAPVLLKALESLIAEASRPAVGAQAALLGAELARAGHVIAELRGLNVFPCCDMHGRHCEPPSELCCDQCTEAGHEFGDAWRGHHADGTVCSNPDVSPT